MGFYRDAAVTLWGEAGAYAHDAYTRWLPLFPELPDELPIVIGITAYGKCLGMSRPCWDHGPRITIESNLFRQGRHLVGDTMVHEMLHVALYVTGRWTGPENGPSHGHAWYTAVRELSPAVLGHDLDVRRGADRRSGRVPNPDYEPGSDQPRTLVRKTRDEDTLPHGDVARWPHPFRPKHWPVGSPIDCPTY